MDRDDDILNYLQGRLSAEDRRTFETTMAQDAALAAEVELMRSVRAEMAAGPKHENASAVWDRLSTAMADKPAAANDNRRPWQQVLQYAAVAAIAVVAWQAAVVPRLGPTDDGFRAASEQRDAFALQVKFADTATLAEITALLAPLGGSITDGPGALGVVRVSFPEADTRDRARAALTAQNDLVEFVAQP